jgi:hypothetical protein
MIRIAGKLAGDTPSSAKLNTFESSTVTLTKDGYAPVTRTITPSEDGTTLDVVLTPMEPRPR